MVGPGQTYTSPCAALTAAADGATIKIDAAGTYSGDVCTITANGITVKGINGRALINAAGLNSGGAAWLFHGNNITIDTVELTGAASSGNNAAAILMTGANLSVLNSYIHDNQVGLQTTANAASQILVQATELNHNGFGNGLTHNLDINAAARFTLQYCYSHNANAGDLVKTQAAENYLLFNRLTSEQGTTASEIDLRGGRSFLIGNLIQKGPNDTGSNVVGYLAGATSSINPSTEFYVVNNTLVNDKSASANFLSIGLADATPAIVTNNIFYGTGAISTQTNAVLTANLTANPLFVNQAAYDYHLTSTSPAINTGTAAGSADGVSLVPGYQYLDPSCGQVRTASGAGIDIGAYEYGGAGAALYCAIAPAGISLNPGTVTGGAVTTSNTVTLSVPAPSTGTLVALASSNSSAAAVPASVTVPSGAISATFGITTSSVTASTPVTISASYSGSSQTAALTILPPAGVSAVQCSPPSLSSGGVSTCTVTLTSGAPSGGATVNLAANTSLLSVPASLSIPAGSLSATFSAAAGSITTSQSATVSATLNGSTKSAALSLLGPVSLASFTCSPTYLRSYSTSNCVVTLTSTAPSGGIAVAVSSTAGQLSVPSSVTIPAGSASASFVAHTNKIPNSRFATVNVQLGNASLAVKFSLSR